MTESGISVMILLKDTQEDQQNGRNEERRTKHIHQRDGVSAGNEKRQGEHAGAKDRVHTPADAKKAGTRGCADGAAAAGTACD